MIAHGRVSVVIPAFNAGRYLSSAIGSVLAQTMSVHEIVVVDDGSTDDTAEIARSFPGTLVIGGEHQGIASARNTGVRAASGEWLAFLDADDLWFPDKLERQFECLAATSAVGTFGWFRSFISPELLSELTDRFVIDPAPSPGYQASTLLISRDGFTSVGDFDVTLDTGEFIDWAARARDDGIVLAMTDGVVSLRRVHGNNTVLKRRETLGLDYLKLVRARLSRGTNR